MLGEVRGERRPFRSGARAGQVPPAGAPHREVGRAGVPIRPLGAGRAPADSARRCLTLRRL